MASLSKARSLTLGWWPFPTREKQRHYAEKNLIEKRHRVGKHKVHDKQAGGEHEQLPRPEPAQERPHEPTG